MLSSLLQDYRKSSIPRMGRGVEFIFLSESQINWDWSETDIETQ